jgi:hypothetical protein
MPFAVDTQINTSYVRQLSKRTIDGKEDRARERYHNCWVPFGYLPPEYPKVPDGAPSTWQPPRMPARPDPITFPALVLIGELAAGGWADRAIADELEGYNLVTSRFGERALTKDTIAAIRRSRFPVLATWHIRSEIRHFESDLLIPFCLQQRSARDRIREHACISSVGTFLSLRKGVACVPFSHLSQAPNSAVLSRTLR